MARVLSASVQGRGAGGAWLCWAWFACGADPAWLICCGMPAMPGGPLLWAMAQSSAGMSTPFGSTTIGCPG